MGANCVLGRDDELIRSILTIQIYICNVFETLNWILFYGIQKEKVKHVADYFEAWKYSSEKKKLWYQSLGRVGSPDIRPGKMLHRILSACDRGSVSLDAMHQCADASIRVQWAL